MQTALALPARLLPIAVGVLLIGCAGQPPRPQTPVIDLQTRFSTPPPTAADSVANAGDWWLAATPVDLGKPLTTAIEASPRARLADASINRARARLRQVSAERGLFVDGRAATGVRKASEQDRSSSRSLGVDASLPVDLAGELAQRERSAQALLVAAIADAEQVRTDLARDLLLAATDVAEARQRHLLLEQQVELAAQLLRLIELRFTQGLATGVDVLQQRDQLAALRQQLPIALVDALRAANRLRALAGLAPGTQSELDLDDLPGLSQAYPEVEPGDLLQRRPMLRATQARLQAADADFAAALADRWPDVSLSASVLNTLLSGDVTNLVAATLDATLVVFDGGRLVAVAEQRRAELVGAGEQLLLDWFDSVLAADTLIQEQASLLQRLALSADRLVTAEALLRATRQRYERGVSDYLPVLEALRGLQLQQRADLALRAELERTRVRLHHALGSAPPAAERAS
jgi:outer membrane protein TolC